MLSILIPIYNYNIVRLVTDLYRQAVDSYVDFEIIVAEDGSTLYVEENKTISELSHCRHIVLEENIGRSALRNKLADWAKYEHLLFMDCDAEVCSSHFIENYLAFRHEECVVIGGTVYDSNENNPDYSLRLKYGREREALPANEREMQKCNSFTTFNFLISKSIFNQVRFDETIQGYGHEDTVFGHALRKLGYEFLHIENPLIHKGLDNNQIFIQKTEEATRNLYLLYKTGRYPFLANDSKLLHSFVRLKKMGTVRLLSGIFKLNKQKIQRNLCSLSPSLRCYDMYKLLFLCYTSLQK